jgi:hypothetical protein
MVQSMLKLFLFVKGYLEKQGLAMRLGLLPVILKYPREVREDGQNFLALSGEGKRLIYNNLKTTLKLFPGLQR